MKYNFIGWCKEGKHDKVWVVIQVKEGNDKMLEPWVYVTAWGRRGKKLQHKLVSQYEKSIYVENISKWCYSWSWTVIDKKIDEKKKKGYNSINVEHLNNVYPEFEEDIKKLAFWGMLQA